MNNGQKVVRDGEASHSKFVLRGVPQGAVPGLILSLINLDKEEGIESCGWTKANN